jgi:hypothetical protein
MRLLPLQADMRMIEQKLNRYGSGMAINISEELVRCQILKDLLRSGLH